MDKVLIANVRDVIQFSGINVIASKQGTGLVHVYAESAQDLSNFAGVARVNRMNVAIDNLNPVTGYIDSNLIGVA